MLMVSLPFTDPFARDAHRITHVMCISLDSSLNWHQTCIPPPPNVTTELSRALHSQELQQGPEKGPCSHRYQPPQGACSFAEQGAQR